MNRESVIIIGGGLAGLATGCYAQLNGYQSHIFEHHAHPGGVAAAWRRGDYLIDGGIHFVMGHKPGTDLYELYRELGVVPGVAFRDLAAYGRIVHEAAGRSVTLTADLDQIGRELKALSPADATAVDELLAGVRALQGLDMSQFGMARPPEMMGPLDQLRDLWSMRRLLRYVVGKYGQTVAEYSRRLESPLLATTLQHLFLPGVPVYFLFMLLALLADGQLGLLEGGCRDFVGAIEKRYRALGGQITYGARVERVLVESDRAVGVGLAEGAPGPPERRAGAVVSAADGRSTIFDLLEGRYLDAKIRKRYETWPRFEPLLMISYGVERTFPHEPAFHVIILEEPLSVAGHQIKMLFLRLFNYSDRFAPPGKTVIQVEFDTVWDYWNDLQGTDRAAYEAEKERVAAQVLARLEAHYPGLAAQVEVTDVSTPYTTWRYTLNDQGSWEGWLMTPKTMTSAVERTLPGLGDFYMAGQWVMPGGGVPPVLYSGRHAIQLLCRRDGKPFR
ncbi:MAG: NAD(P)-binding protein [Anaerolineae bacterium]